MSKRSGLVVGMVAVLLLASSVASAQLNEQALSKRASDGDIWARFKASMAKLTTYMGSGTYVAHEFSDDPYVSEELLIYPRFSLGAGKSLRLYWVLECEMTDPGRNPARACDPSDTRLSYHDVNIWKDPWLKGTFMGSAQLWFPTSYASINNNTIMNVRLSGSYMKMLLNDKLELSYGFAVQKYLPTTETRGSVIQNAGRLSSGDAVGGSTGSGSNRNDNWLFINSLHAGVYFTKQWSLSVDLLVYNYIRFTPEELPVSPDPTPTGRADWTWGIIEAAYQPLDYFSVALGISSLQPALTADAKSVRFPFYDFISPQNNFTKWYLVGTFIY